MNFFSRSRLLFTVVLSVFSIASAATTIDNDEEYSESIQVASNKATVTFGGRVFGDWLWSSADDSIENQFGNLPASNEWRAAWLEINGSYDNNITFRVQYDFAGGDPVAKDVWIAFNGFSFGTIKIGHMKEPFSLEQQVSTKNTVFMERSLADVFAPARNTGITISGNSKDFTWSAGLFTEADNLGNATAHDDDNYNASIRLTYTPMNTKKSLIHLGIAYHYQSIKENETLRIRQRPESHMAYRLIDTGSFAAESMNVIGLEGLIKTGRFMLQGEYMGAYVDSETLNDPGFNGFYVLASIFLTEDERGYSSSSAVPSGVSPSNPFHDEGGLGAWEIAVRYSQLDLDDEQIVAGILKNTTLGINWYLNKYVRIMLNYVNSEREDLGTLHIFQTRYQFSF